MRNDVDDADLSAQALPDLKDCTGIESLDADAAYGSPAADEQLNEQQVEFI